VTVAHSDRAYIPAAGRHWRLPFYDLLATLLGADPARQLLVEQVAPRPGDRVLDVGTGTGSLAVELKRLQPRAEVVALDPDPRALAIARRKAERASVVIQFDRGFADALPYPGGSFDHVTSSLVFHHLSLSDKQRALREIRRVLKPGGLFHMLDFDGPITGRAGFLARRVHASGRLRESAEDRVLALMTGAGLENPRVVGRRVARLVHLAYYQAGVMLSGSSRR
jgi:ubiquinone/menaquinone biosynthesis C-methylase UbiE